MDGNSEADMWQMYRFADTLDEVNWSARYRPDNEFMSRYIIPGLIEKTEESSTNTCWQAIS